MADLSLRSTDRFVKVHLNFDPILGASSALWLGFDAFALHHVNFQPPNAETDCYRALGKITAVTSHQRNSSLLDEINGKLRA